ncbi:hypothetical protein L1887_20846 [Cichorium endivia]|nr:hypothetical protein L1887_20846 [Cichorium endivia]
MCTPRATVPQHTHRRFTSVDNPCFTNILKSPMTLISTVTSSSSAPTFNRRPLIVCKSSVNQVAEVVTGCTWTELVVAADVAVMVEFWATECVPCRMVSNVVDELAEEYAGKALCYKLNIDDYPNVASQYGIKTIPTLLFFKNGEEQETLIGVVPKSTVSATLDKYIE